MLRSLKTYKLVMFRRQESWTLCAKCLHAGSLGGGDRMCCNYLGHAFMMTSSYGDFFRVAGPLCGEFTGPGEFPAQRPVTRSFDVFFDLCPNKRLSKQPWGWWFDTPSWSLWRQCNVLGIVVFLTNSDDYIKIAHQRHLSSVFFE